MWHKVLDVLSRQVINIIASCHEAYNLGKLNIMLCPQLLRKRKVGTWYFHNRIVFSVYPKGNLVLKK